jgi:hypothetical protein
LKNKGRIYAGIYVVTILLLFIFIVCWTISQTSQQPGTTTTLPTTQATPTTQPTTTPVVVLIDTPILYDELFCREFDTIENVEAFIARVDDAVNNLTGECAIADKYIIEAITAMIEEIDRLTAEQTYAASQKARMLKWAEKEEEYYYATQTWKYLKALGYSDIACAGILGNLMAECGGHTLKLDPYLYDKATGKYYGMFQWSTYYYPAINGGSFEEQLDFYAKTSIYVFNTFGSNYASGFTLDDFNELSDPREAALAFAKVYERCASWTYERRQNFSEIAYKYFVLDFEGI